MHGMREDGKGLHVDGAGSQATVHLCCITDCPPHGVLAANSGEVKLTKCFVGNSPGPEPCSDDEEEEPEAKAPCVCTAEGGGTIDQADMFEACRENLGVGIICAWVDRHPETAEDGVWAFWK